MLLWAGSCRNPKTAPAPVVTPVADLPDIQARGTLRALIAYSATSYFLYRGQTMGYEYEMLKRLANDLGLELELQVADNLDQMLDILEKGEVDLVAHGMAVTRERQKHVAFTDYLYLTKQMLVQRKPRNWRNLNLDQIRGQLVQDPVELIGDTVSVRKNSSYLERLDNLSREIGGAIHIDTLGGHYSTDEIIKMVVDRKIKYTVADRNLARINASHYPILDVSVPVSFSQRIAWAVPRDAPHFLAAINNWIAREKKQNDYYVIYNKYFKNRRSFSRRVKSPFYSLNEGRISPFDEAIKAEARELGWDWRLLASVIYQESRFDPEATSWTGAQGLMQLMPATAAELGVEDRTDAEQSLDGGTRYLRQLYNRFNGVQDSLQRIKFALAAYNCGYEHVEDARNLAQEEGLDRNAWDRNVDSMLLALKSPENYQREVVRYGYVRGEEPYRYVQQIFERYEHYASLAR
ncbi:transporter substrate-binding domain-containing protein [Robiginitalea sp. M366]|uniref:transglycosylase SLT domain-containing protein n=1 Tax=Robiginitalea aestuariiviva TaxID=3036903 RepID=UPI00240D6934|nr:transporter substrate-binding domain-containing protein [Robiginitalea aestuariiviva]MDG1571546.1 transporter substrate-binding domain-containing protein [Robiginitalea aestuariiviva]